MNDIKHISGNIRGYGSTKIDNFMTANLKESQSEQNVVNFEEAISATGFGRFNYILLLVAIPSCWSSLFVPITTAFILPEVQCDLGLSLLQMGILNASPFIGMILSAIFWGYLSDTFGRKHLLVYGYLADGFCNIICAFSFNIWMLGSLKFASGFICAGPFAILMSYLSEFHSSIYRSRVIIITGIYIGSVNFILPMLAWIIMPMEKLHIVNYVISPWQIYILVCAIPSLVSGLLYTFLPESPKFLLVTGQHDEALTVLKEMYAMNYCKSKDEFPISGIITNIPTKKLNENESSTLQALKNGWNQIKPLFFKPYITPACLLLCIQFCLLLGSNTLRLWLPQLFTIMDDYQQINGNYSESICEIINFSRENITLEINATCQTVSNDQVYINSGIVGICTITMFIIVAFVINKTSKKIVLGLLYLISGTCGLALIWSTNPLLMLTFSSIYTSLTGVAFVTLISVVVEIFPTSLRAMTVSLTMMTGRVGTIIGNVIFPVLLGVGCLPPFLLIGGIVLICIPMLMFLSSPKEEDFK